MIGTTILEIPTIGGLKPLDVITSLIGEQYSNWVVDFLTNPESTLIKIRTLIGG